MTRVRVAIVAESFLPDVNGVTNSVLRVVEHLERRGIEAVVIAPGFGPTQVQSTPVERVPGIVLDRYGSISVGLPTRRVQDLLADFRPDVVHVAAPVVLGAAGLAASRRLGIPTVAVYQTDLPSFATEYGLGLAHRRLWTYLKWVHHRADVTLAPSWASIDQLRGHGVRGVLHWPRGVDQQPVRPGPAQRPAPPPALARRASARGLRRTASPPRSRSTSWRRSPRDPRVQLVIVGDGPARPELERRLPGARFLGFRSGTDLATAHASLDVFVHTGCHETFCQAVQEALSSGVPVVAPAAGGPLDTVEHMANGLLWDPARPSTIIDRVETLHDEVLRHRLAAAARPSVRQPQLGGHRRRPRGALRATRRPPPRRARTDDQPSPSTRRLNRALGPRRDQAAARARRRTRRSPSSPRVTQPRSSATARSRLSGRTATGWPTASSTGRSDDESA